jgi:hypothetical protein
MIGNKMKPYNDMSDIDMQTPEELDQGMVQPMLEEPVVEQTPGIFASMMKKLKDSRAASEAARIQKIEEAKDNNFDPKVEELAKRNDPLYSQDSNENLQDIDTRIALQQAIKDQNRKPSVAAIPEEIKNYVTKKTLPVAPKVDPKQSLPEVPTEESQPLVTSASIEQPDMSIEELRKAQDLAKTGQLMGLFSNISSNVAESNAPGFKSNRQFATDIQNVMGQEAKDVVGRQTFDKGNVDLQSGKIDLSSEKDLNDPNSAVSIQARELAKELIGSDVPVGLTAAQLNKLLPGIQQKASLDFKREESTQRAEDRKLQREELAAKRGEYKEMRGTEEARRVNENYNKFLDKRTADNPMFKKFVEKQDTFNRIDDLIDSAQKGNQASVAALGTQMARAMGEVGVLTDADVTRYLGNSSYGRKLQSWFTKGMQGKIPPAQANELKEVGETFRNLNEIGVNKIYDDAAVRFSQSYPDSADSEEERLQMAYKRLGHPMFTKETRKKAAELKGEPTKVASAPSEVKRKTKDGKTAIFDAQTKKFLRYE